MTTAAETLPPPPPPLPAAAAAPGAIPICSWYAYDKNVAVAGYCHLNPVYYAVVPQEPTTFVSK